MCVYIYIYIYPFQSLNSVLTPLSRSDRALSFGCDVGVERLFTECFVFFVECVDSPVIFFRLALLSLCAFGAIPARPGPQERALCRASRAELSAFVLQVDDFLRVLARLGLKVAFLQRRWRLGFELLYSVDTSPADGIGAQFWVLHHEFLMLRFRAAFLLDKLSVLYVVF